jgi:hypothetical protein
MHDQWQVSRKLTVNYGVRYEDIPFPRKKIKASAITIKPTIQECGVGGIPGDCGIKVSHKLFSSIGIAYRASDKLRDSRGILVVAAAGPIWDDRHPSLPDEAQSTINGPNGFAPAGTVSGTGAPVIPLPVIVNGKTPGSRERNLFTNPLNFVRGYIQSYNFTLQRQFRGGMTAQIGYVGAFREHVHPCKLQLRPTGRALRQPLSPYGMRVASTLPFFSDNHNALQSMFQKRYAAGFNLQAQFTYSHDIGPQSATVAILVPQYRNRNNSTTIIDRTFNFSMGAAMSFLRGKASPI